MNDYEQGGSGNEQRAILAIVLSLAVYWLWASWASPPVSTTGEQEIQPPALSSSELTKGQQMPAQQAGSSVQAGSSTEEQKVPKELQDLPAPEQEEQTFPLSTEQWHAQWTTHGGAMRSLVLPGHPGPYLVTPLHSWLIKKLTTGTDEPWIPYKGADGPEQLISEAALFASAGSGGGNFTDGAYSLLDLSPDKAVFQRISPDGIRIVKSYELSTGEYQGSLVVRFENVGDETFNGSLWVGLSDDATGKAGRYSNVARPAAVVNGSLETQNDVSELVAAPARHEGQVSWIGISNRYFLTAMVPEDHQWGNLVFAARDPEYAGAYLVTDQLELKPGQGREFKLHLYAGPKELSRLVAMGDDLDKAVQFGWFGFFARILLWLLRHLHALVGNWGVAIIGLTLLVKGLFFPLTQKAFRSAKEMQRLQPQLNEVKEKFKDNKEMQTQETMRLFKEHKVNPMGGCLPTLIQLPVWIALYNVLLFSVDLYHSSFLVYRDLSAPDPYSLLPILVGILMFVQQKMTPMTGMDPTQAKMMRLMPLIFVFFIFSFPSGLAIYILVNSILTILQQWLINKNYQKSLAST